MSRVALKDKKYTYEDYVTWPEDERWEIIEGTMYSMSPAPSVKHQRIVGSFFSAFRNTIDRKCPVFDAPTDVVFDEYNVVQPDVLAVCDKEKITEANIQGAPDLIVEVASPTTEVKDRRDKKNLYEKFGVREYVIVFPEREYLEKYVLKEGAYGPPEIFNWDEVLVFAAFEIQLHLWEIFEREKEKTGQP